jgi:hypothetical protein
MSANPQLYSQMHLYALCWNDAKIIPFFLRHYADVVDRFFIYDNGSTDDSLCLLKGDERVEVRHFEVPGRSFVEEELRLSETIWKESRDEARWICMVDLDEHLFHPNMVLYLDRCWREGVTVIDTQAYEMISDSFPPLGQTLSHSVTTGFRDPSYDKLCIFDPNAIVRTGYTPGRHRAKPEGRVIYPAQREMLLLHYKSLGYDYLAQRNGQLAKGLKPGDIALNYGSQYLLAERELRAKFAHQRRSAAPIPGLAAQVIPVLQLEVGGRRLDPIQAADNRYSFVLPRRVSRFVILAPGGVAVTRIRLSEGTRAQEIALDGTALREGWLAWERVGTIAARWTDDVAALELPPEMCGLALVEIEVVWPAP